MSLWILGFYGSIFSAYLVYCCVQRNLTTILYIIGKTEAYGIIMYRYFASFFKSKKSVKQLDYNNTDDIDIKFNQVEDQLTQCRVNNLSENSDTCKYKFMLIEVALTEFTVEKKITISLENKDKNFTVYVSNNKLDKHFWKWYLESFYNDQVNSVFTRWNVIKYSITIMDNHYKHIKINQDDTIWLKKFNYEIIKPTNSNKVFKHIENKRIHMKRNNYNGDGWSADEDSILTCPNLADSSDISKNPNSYYKCNN